ncbi:MAG: FkbM family methyltransferase [Bacteroidetes bacterium]|nr:FkbM family methyltransferase [Bacteroidota bacterium]
MSFKENIKKTLGGMGLLKPLQELHYKASFLNPSSDHPRKKIFSFYRQFVPKGSLVFDIGANIGERVSIFNELGAATIIAVEPQVHCVEKMKTKFGKNKHVQIENIGLGATEGEMDFYICDEDDRLSTFSTEQMENSFFSGRTVWNRKATIQVLKLDSLIEKYGMPAFCKIDVEGFEINVLNGLTKPIPALSFEFSSKQMDKVLACMNQLKKIDPRYVFNVCFGEPYQLDMKTWSDQEAVTARIEKEDKVSPTHAWGDIYAKIA